MMAVKNNVECKIKCNVQTNFLLYELFQTKIEPCLLIK